MRVSFLALLLVMGCAGRGAADRSTGWWQLASAHAVVRTDGDPETLTRGAERIERTLAALGAAMPGCDAPPDITPIDVVVATHDEDFQTLTSEGGDVALVCERAGVVVRPTTLVLRTERALSSPDLVHLLAHRVAIACDPHARPWAIEGLATFFETMTLGDASTDVGARPARLDAHGIPASPEELGLDAHHFYVADRTHRMHFAAHNFVPEPANPSRDARFTLAWALIDDALMAEPTTALWLPCILGHRDRCETTYSPAVLPSTLARTETRAIPFTTPSMPMSSATPIAPAEMDLWWASLLRTRHEIDAHLAFASEDETTQLLATLLRAAEAQDEEAIRAAVAGQPRSHVTLHALAFVERTRESPSSDALRVLAALAGSTDLAPDDLAESARLAVRLGRTELAVATLRSAIARSPTDALLYEALADVLHADGLEQEERLEAEVAPSLCAHARQH